MITDDLWWPLWRCPSVRLVATVGARSAVG